MPCHMDVGLQKTLLLEYYFVQHHQTPANDLEHLYRLMFPDIQKRHAKSIDHEMQLLQV